LPGKFGDAARGVLSTVDQWVQFADRVLAVLNRLNSKIPGSIEDLIAVITGGLTKAQAKVEAVLDDIFGPVQGQKSGKGFAEGFMGQIKDIFSGKGGITGVIGNILGVGGIIVGAVSLGKAIWGGLKSLFGFGGPSDEEKAAIEQAKKEAAQNFARNAQEIINAGLEGMKSALELFNNLADYTGTARKSIKRFINDLEFLLHEMFDALKKFADANFATMKAFGESMGPALSMLSSALSLFQSLRDYTKVPEQAIKDLISDFSILEGLLETALADVELKVVKQMGKISNKLINSFELLKLALEVIKGAGEYKPIEASIFDSLFSDLYTLVDRFAEMADEFKRFALAKTKKTAEQMASIVESIGSSVAVLKSIGEYQKIGEEVFSNILTDLREVLGWQDDMIALADEGILKGLTFEDRMTQWRDTIARGLSALASIAGGSFSVSAASSGLSASAFSSTSLAPSSRLSPSAAISGGPSPITQQGGGDHISVTFAPGSIVVPGLVGSDTELLNKIGEYIVRAVTVEKRRGRIQFATN
jgi:hypothetical protein